MERDTSLEDLFRELLFVQMHRPRSSATANLLASNVPPSDIDRLHYEKVVEYGQGDIRNISLRLKYARAVVGHLDRQLDLAVNNVEDARTIVHPMRRFNDDVLLEVFQHCVQMESTPNSIDIRGMPWTLSQVCCRWRGLAINTGRLWTRVRLDFGRDEAFMESVGASYLLSNQLLRAAPFDVDVSIEGSPVASTVNRIFQTLVPFSPQVRSLTIDAGASSYRFLSACRGFFQHLQSLSICDASYYLFEGSETEGPYHDLTIDAFAFAPRLECLRVHALPLQSVALASVTLGSVVQFSTSLYSQWTTVFRLISQMNKLESLDLLCDCDVDAIDDDPSPVIVPSLRRLTLRDPDGWQNISVVWDKVDVSQVTTVVLSYQGEYSVITYPSLLASVASITELHVHVGEFVDNSDNHSTQMISFLRYMPNVATFCIRTFSHCSLFFREVSRESQFLPNLREILFGYEGGVDAEGDAQLIEAVYIRATNPAFRTVEKISLRSPLSYSTDLYRQKWDALCRNGQVIVEVDDFPFCYLEC